MVSWNDIEHAVHDNTLESLDTKTLEAFLKLTPPNNNNPGLIAQWQDARDRIRRCLDQRERDAQEQREATQITTSIRWSKIAAVAALVSIGLMILQILISVFQWYPSTKHDAPPTQTQVQNIQQPTKSRANLSSSLSSSTRSAPLKKTK